LLLGSGNSGLMQLGSFLAVGFAISGAAATRTIKNSLFMAGSLENRDNRTTTSSNNLSPIRLQQMCGVSHLSVCPLLTALGFNLHRLQPSMAPFK
jgi:hypothetical protein